MDKRHILILSRQPNSVSSLQVDILPHAGFGATVATDFKEALWHIRQAQPVLLLLHIAQSGDWQVLEELREEGVALPAILLAPPSLDAIPLRAVRLGISGYLPWPLPAEEAVAALSEAVAAGLANHEPRALRQELDETRQELERRSLTLTALYGLGRSLVKVMDKATLLDYVAESAMHLVMADESAILMADPDNGELRLEVLRGIGPDATPNNRLRIENSLAEMVMQTGEPLLIANVREAYNEVESWHRPLRSLLNVPLKLGERTFGVLSAIARTTDRSFTADDLLLLSVLADYAAISWENAQLYDDRERAAAMDIFRQTVAALSHHINNPLTALMAGVHALNTYLLACDPAEQPDAVQQALRTIAQKAEEIATVIAVLQEVTSPKSTPYWREEKMIDIERDVRRRLRALQESWNAQGRPRT